MVIRRYAFYKVLRSSIVNLEVVKLIPPVNEFKNKETNGKCEKSSCENLFAFAEAGKK